MDLRKIFFLLPILLFFVGSASSQIKEQVFFNRTFCSDSYSDFLKAEVTIKKDKLSVTYYSYKKDWKKIKKNVYESICDSVYINKSVGFNRHTIPYSNHVIYKIIVKKIGPELFSFKEYSYNNILLREGICKSYFPLVKHEKVIQYYPDGKISSISEYDNNLFLTSQKWRKDGVKSNNDVYMEVEIAPKHKEKSLKNYYAQLLGSISYPINPGREKFVEGICIIEFILDKHGEIKDLQFIENTDFPVIDNQICNYIRENKDGWTPAEISGKKVDYIVQLVVSFSES